ncbi:hypothetical protein [Bradyrhizobium cenepequi]
MIAWILRVILIKRGRFVEVAGSGHIPHFQLASIHPADRLDAQDTNDDDDAAVDVTQRGGITKKA